MIIKHTAVPILNLKLEALARRLSQSHKMRPIVLEELARRQKGYLGEGSLDYYLDPLPYKDFHIFYDTRLKNGKYHFQIDSLLLTPQFAVIIEVKNFSGDIHYDAKSKQFFRVINGNQEGIKNPIAQAERQQRELLRWFNKNNFKPVPIEFLVAIKEPATKIMVTPGGEHILEKILHFDHLANAIFDIQRRYKKPILDHTLIQSIGKKLISSHTPSDVEVLTKYGINKSDLITGVRCPTCNSYPMRRIPRRWQCPTCYAESKTAHEQAIHDYILLISTTITNLQSRHFLHIEDRSLATRILSAMNLPHTGEHRGRVYYRPE
ncbi:nuclease-related domain-containing protein [Aquibacillus saliphilus]|uniref:nuclease-related domain-containing protein n=1 Tax=Aquibacillus saliphilus TaxID=1909422 RepID=UPI001CF0B0F4|nr:nuclease-related domain-containing protein [Aquibacillus saliphilus]